VGIVFASFYPDEIRALVEGAKKELITAGMPAANISEHEVAGSFEIPLIGAALTEAKKVDALIGIGIIVEGETHHARLLAESVAHGIMDVQVRYQIPFAFEVLYVKDLAQAKVRAEGEDNKGGEAARAVLHSLAQMAKLHS
jgi:6,7-dimethyl-8-ribityllumazine synthase